MKPLEVTGHGLLQPHLHAMMKSLPILFLWANQMASIGNSSLTSPGASRFLETGTEALALEIGARRGTYRWLRASNHSNATNSVSDRQFQFQKFISTQKLNNGPNFRIHNPRIERGLNAD